MHRLYATLVQDIKDKIRDMPRRFQLLYPLAWMGLASIPWFTQHVFHDFFLVTGWYIFDRQDGTIVGVVVSFVLDVTAFYLFMWRHERFVYIRQICLKIYGILLFCCVVEIPTTFILSQW